MRHDFKAILAAAVVSGACAMALPASAQVLTQKTISLPLALELAQATMSECTAKGLGTPDVVVVDPSGAYKVVLHSDTQAPAIMENARRKAVTSARYKAPTAALAMAVAKGGGVENIVHFPDVMAVAGGIPIKAGDDVIGALGVGGTKPDPAQPGGYNDAVCGQAGLDKVASKLK